MFNSDLGRLVVIILIILILGSLFIWIIPYIIFAGIAVWITRKILKFFNSKKKNDEKIEVVDNEETFDEMKKDAVDVDYEEINNKKE